jgi:hypothetical protein
MNGNISAVAALIFIGGAINLLADVAHGSSGQGCETLSAPALPTDFPPTLNGGGNGGGNPG